MSEISRRDFVRVIPAVTLGLSLGSRARADDGTLAETDSDAVARGYRADATKVDRAKFPKYASGQTCANCSLYVGDAGSPDGGCSLFYGRSVAARGWCDAWEKKA
jgi:hypothetical protein